ncbi:TRAP transporter permease, partial [Chloroflexota bacterium]
MNEIADKLPDLADKIPALKRYRNLSGFWRVLFMASTAAGCLISIYYIFAMSYFGVFYLTRYLAVFMGLFFPFVFLLFPASSSASRDKVPWYDILLFICALILPVWLTIHATDILYKAWGFKAPFEGLAIAVLTWPLLFEASRRVVGVSLAALVGLFSIFPLFAGYAPGFLEARSIPVNQLLSYLFIGQDGVTGLLLEIIGRLIIGFILFGVALTATGASDVFLTISMKTMSRFRGGAGKVSVLSSAMFATLSGVTLSNVITTGSFTIPAMKKSGYAPERAAATEACASCGGTVTPPVMGAAAFIIAEFLEMPYAAVCLAAAIPAICYFFAVLVQADFYAAKTGLKGLGKEYPHPSWWSILKDGWYIPLGVLLLIFFLFA